MELFLHEQRVKHWHRINANGKSQVSELSAWMNGKHVRLEVKCAGQKHFRELMWPAIQKIEAEFVIGVRLDERASSADIMGYLPRSMIMEKTTVSPARAGGNLTRRCMFTVLSPIALLIQLLDKEQ